MPAPTYTNGVILAHQKLAVKLTENQKNLVQRLWEDFPRNQWQKESVTSLTHRYHVSNETIRKVFEQLSANGCLQYEQFKNGNGHIFGARFKLNSSVVKAKNSIAPVVFNESEKTLAKTKTNGINAEPPKTVLDSRTVSRGAYHQRDHNMQLQREYLRKMFDAVSEFQEFQSSYKMMAELTDIPMNIVDDVMTILKAAGLFRRRYVNSGRVRRSLWTITGTYDECLNAIDKAQKAYINRVAKRAPRIRTTEPANVPVEGGSLTQARALVKNCRNFMKSANIIANTMASLKAAGVEVDEEQFMNSIGVNPDDRLSAIALVMPYIDWLENKCK